MTSASVASGFPNRMLSMIDDPNSTGSCGERLELQHLDIFNQELHKWSVPDWWIQQLALSTRTNPVSVYPLHPAWSRRWSGHRNAPARKRRWTFLQCIARDYFQALGIIINIKNQAVNQRNHLLQILQQWQQSYTVATLSWTSSRPDDQVWWDS